MTKKEVATILKPYNDDIKRHMGALEEHFTDGVKAVGEKVDLFGARMDRRFEEIDKTLNSHTVILNSHTQMIGNIMIQLEEIKNELKQKVDYSDFVKLEKRVVRLETRAVH